MSKCDQMSLQPNFVLGICAKAAVLLRNLLVMDEGKMNLLRKIIHGSQT